MRNTVLITGTSSGLGKAAAKYFESNDWNVIATMRVPSAETELVNTEQMLVTRLDVQEPSSIDHAIKEGIQCFGKIDALVNNAGFGLFGLFEETPMAKAREQFDVNVFGVMNVTRAILPVFRANRRGTIVNVSSGAGVFTLPMLSLYCASKFALEGFSESLSYELAPQGIVVKIVEPGGVVSTNFGTRSVKESVANSSLGDYEAFSSSVNKLFAELRASRLGTEDEVAKIIFDAVTDGTDQLRYVATEDIKLLVTARRETSEASYMALMRSRFLPSA